MDEVELRIVGATLKTAWAQGRPLGMESAQLLIRSLLDRNVTRDEYWQIFTHLEIYYGLQWDGQAFIYGGGNESE